MTKQNKIKGWLMGAGAVILLVLFDQWTKFLAVVHLKEQSAVPLWKDVFELSYVENRGAAFGMMQNKQIFFLILTAVVVVFLLLFLMRMPEGKRYLPGKVTLLFLGAGAIGNFIDRISQGYVVDFFYFKWIDFPVFNVADIYVTAAVAALAYLLLFYYSEEEIDEIVRLKR